MPERTQTQTRRITRGNRTRQPVTPPLERIRRQRNPPTTDAREHRVPIHPHTRRKRSTHTGHQH
ncbi:hypothetical protein, partial [Streptomyces synnematoformans]|uniref:hypothetical protein n=1 Tax=Streptomyces synnematoformans TaxID=415721 RepID=UPI0031E0829F